MTFKKGFESEWIVQILVFERSQICFEQEEEEKKPAKLISQELPIPKASPISSKSVTKNNIISFKGEVSLTSKK